MIELDHEGIPLERDDDASLATGLLRFGGGLVMALLLGVAVYLGARVFGPQPVLAVKCEPTAAVYVDGVYRGTTPVRVEGLARGTHALRVERYGYRPHREAVLVKGGELRTVSLEPRANAAFRVTSDPAGAQVRIDGQRKGQTPLRLDDLAPGRHHVEVVLTNYFPAEDRVTLTAGESQGISFDLEHRQVRAYYAAIEEAPDDLAAYNDLGELLYVLGRYEEAAEVYVRGLVRAGEGGKGLSKRSRHNLGKMEHEVRNKHDAPAFREALDTRILQALREGEKGGVLLEQFKEVSARKHGRAYLDAIEALLAQHPDDGELNLRMAERYVAAKEPGRAAELLRRTGGRGPRMLLASIEAGLDLLGRAPDEPISSVLRDHIRAAGRAELDDDERAELAFLQARFAFHRGAFEDGLRLAEESIDTSRQGRRAQERRLFVAEQLLSRDRDEEAGRLVHEVLQSEHHRGRIGHEARKLWNRVPARLRKTIRKEAKEAKEEE